MVLQQSGELQWRKMESDKPVWLRLFKPIHL